MARRGILTACAFLATTTVAHAVDIERNAAELLAHCDGSRVLSSQFDCGCVAERYARQKPDVGWGNWLGTTENYSPHCIDERKLVATETEQCLEVPGTGRARALEFRGVKLPGSGAALDAYCACVARTIHAEFVKGYDPSLRAQAKIRSNAYKSCSQ